MNRTYLEIFGGVVIVALLAFIGIDQFHKAVSNAVAQTVAQHDKEAQAKIDATLKDLETKDAERQKQYDAKLAALDKMTPQQIVQKVPDYVAVPKPIIVAGPTTQTAQVGDAIVPQEDIKPLAQAILNGKQCSEDLTSCKVQVSQWQDKYNLKSNEAQQWEKAAKGGSWLKRLGSNALKVGIGVGIGYLAHR